MLDLDHVNAAITEAGPLDEEIQAVFRLGDDQWVIEFEPVIVELECDAENDRLMLSCVIGPVPDERRVEMLEALLTYSMLWRDTRGVRMGLTGPDGDAVQMVELTGDEIEPKLIATVAANLAERTLLWRGMLAGGSEETAGEASAFGENEQHIKI